MSFLGLFGGKKKSIDLPSAPSFQPDPNVGWSQDTLKGQTNYLLNGLTQQGGNLTGLLGDTINLNPDISQLAMTRLQASLDPVYRQRRQDTINTLEANNQLTGSTTGSSLGNLEADYLSALTAAGAEASIADINRALQNRVSLYGTGLNTAQVVGQQALTNQSQTNQFALANYDNQLAEVLGEQPPATGGFAGALTGAAGGALAGYQLGGPYGAAAGAALGGYSGYTGSPQTGGAYLGSGALLTGLNKNNGNRLITSGGSSQNESILNTQYSPYYSPLTYSSVMGGF